MDREHEAGIIRSLKMDSRFLRDNQLMDYSLLQYLTYYFLDKPSLQITLNQQPVSHQQYTPLFSTPEVLLGRYTSMPLAILDTPNHIIDFHHVSLQNYKIGKYHPC